MLILNSSSFILPPSALLFIREIVMPEITEKCAHPRCKCPAQTVGGYCGEFCKNAMRSDEIECKCGHAECK